MENFFSAILVVKAGSLSFREVLPPTGAAFNPLFAHGMPNAQYALSARISTPPSVSSCSLRWLSHIAKVGRIGHR